MSPACIKAIRQLHKLLTQVAEQVAAIRPLLEEELERRDDIAALLNKRLDVDPECPAAYASDREASRRADIWASEAAEAQEIMGKLANYTDALDTLAREADVAAWMLANRSTVFELSSDDDSRVCALADAARNALPDAPRYTLDATARAVLALPADVAYPVEVANG